MDGVNATDDLRRLHRQITTGMARNPFRIDVPGVGRDEAQASRSTAVAALMGLLTAPQGRRKWKRRESGLILARLREGHPEEPRRASSGSLPPPLCRMKYDETVQILSLRSSGSAGQFIAINVVTRRVCRQVIASGLPGGLSGSWRKRSRKSGAGKAQKCQRGLQELPASHVRPASRVLFLMPGRFQRLPPDSCNRFAAEVALSVTADLV